MPLSDAAVLGANIISEEHFGDGFRDDFETLDLETSSAPGNRTGKWKYGFVDANMSEFGFTYGSDENVANGDNFVHANINQETQVYPDTRKPHPTGYQPITVNNGILKIESRLVLPSEQDWARLKGFDLNPDGTLGAFRRDLQAKYISGMISTYGRFGMSFGRHRSRAKQPYGADGASADINQRSAVFPAMHWNLQDKPYAADINGDPFGDGRNMYAPGRPNGGGVFSEIDINENFGESRTAIHQTTHFQPPGTPNGGSDSMPKTLETGSDIRANWVEAGADVFPEKIAFFINGVYTHIVDTPDEIMNGMPRFVPDPAQPFLPIMDSANVARTNGRQTYEDGSTKFMKFVNIVNVARDGKFPRDFARQFFESGVDLPPHMDTVTGEIDWLESRPLLSDNPDKFPMVLNGQPVEADGAAPVTTEIFTPVSGQIPSRENFTILNQPEGVNSGSFVAKALLPDGDAPEDHTYSWSAGTGLAIIGPDDQRECEFTFTIGLAAGESARRSINLDINPA